jgi:uncharacterized protein YjbI with pentapeptide repeats
MANEEHLAVLRQGVDAWFEWRKDHPDVVPDLRSANFRGADLDCAYLSGTDLSQANLREAGLRESDLSDAKLTRASLDRADLSLGDLRGADLSGANLGEAIFRGADLRGADLSRALVSETVFAGVYLSATKGLGSCNHLGPSSLDLHTLQRSGRLPLTFLRGCGLPDRVINYLPSLLDEAIQYYSCFISYSSKDDAFAKRLHADLQNNGVRCWFAPEDMKIGDKFRHRIDEAIHVHERLLLILSDNSVSSEWVEKEVETAFEKEQREKRTVLFPVRLDDAIMECHTGWSADIRRTRHIGDFRRWKDHDAYQQAFNRVLRDLKAAPG